MSLHADLSPEALHKLHAQRRNSTISSILISMLSVVLVALILGIFLLPAMIQESPPIVTYIPNSDDPPDDKPDSQRVKLERKPAAPATNISKVIAATTFSPTAVQVPDVDVTTPSMDFGMTDDFGDAWGDSAGFGGGFGNVPASMQKRCSESDRKARMKESGGNAKCETAVLKALRWLQKTQKEDGSWDDTYPVAMTGLALLAYLGHCETHESEEFGDTVTRAITYLVNVGLKGDGILRTNPPKGHAWVYEHGIATYALAEAFTLGRGLKTQIPDLDTVTKKAGDIIIKGQGDSGGWVYGYAKTNSGDNSVGFWQIQALKACKHTGLWRDTQFTKVSRNALEFLERVQGKDGAIGYRENPNQSPGLTGGAVLCFQLWDDGNSKSAKAGIDYLTRNMAFKWNTGSSNLYYQYYNAQAMINHGGKEWDKYNKLFRDELLDGQERDGSWNPRKQTHGPVNAHMATCLATLMLEVYYRFLPGTGAK
jgi:hypothetical protein